MARLVRFSVETLWQGDKGTNPQEFEYYPARSLFTDGSGVWFSITPRNDLWISNALHHRLFRVNLSTGRVKMFPNPLAPDFHPEGGCPVAGQLGHLAVLMIAAKQPSQIVHLDREAKICSAFSLAEIVPFIPPVWFRAVPSRGSYLCSHRHFQLRGLVGEGQLREYSMRTGELIQTITGVTGTALGWDGTIYLSGRVPTTRGVICMEPPKGLDAERWLLIGVDNRKRFYWYMQEPAGRWTVSWIACGEQNGQLLWKAPLTGPEGVLASVDTHLQIRLGWGCEWIEVSRSGDIEVFAWSGSERVRKGVGVYRLRWQSR